MEQFPADSWVAAQSLETAPAGTQYVRSLYWTVVTMTTVGYGDITPARNVEYVFAILVILAGASLYAYIIGNIASLLSNLDAAKVAFWNRADAVNQYLRSRQVPNALNEHIRGYYEYLWARHHGLADKDMFVELPESVRIDLLHHLTGDLLKDFEL
jgi:voltage-gated potassium channel